VSSINTFSVAKPQGRKRKFANETPQQQADHREIALSYGDNNHQDRLKVNLRKHQLEMFFIYRHGSRQLPDDDAGRDYLRVMADHLMLLGENYVFWWAARCAPWASHSEMNELIIKCGSGRYWPRQALARELQVDSETRFQLKIWSFGAVDKTLAELAADRAERKAATEAERRRRDGATPRALSEAQQKPWVKLGISESTYRRRKRRNKKVDSISCSISLQYLSGTKHGHGAPPPKGGSEARAVPALSDGDTVISAGRDVDRFFMLPREAKLLLTVSSSSM
jgi:hypothetical protein